MSFWPRVEKDPFRLFFPLGAIMALAGVAPWSFQLFGYSEYLRDFHRAFMINGFLLSFVCGFLMTAIPRFTGAEQAKKSEICGILLAILGGGAANFLPSKEWSFLFAATVVSFLAAFALRRFLKRSSNPPYTFVFIGVGLVLWFIGNLGQFFLLRGTSLPVEIFDQLFTNGALMSLILGVGGRLIPGILGWQEIVSHQRKRYETPEPFLNVVPREIWIAVLVFLLSFALAPIIPAPVCFCARGIVAAFFGIKFWRLHRLPRTKSYLTWSIWLSCWCLAVGYFLPVLWPTGGVHAMHALFIGGFSLLTLLISSRVTFAHSSVGTDLERTSPGILVFAGVLLFSMVTRVTAILWPRIYLDHLGYAAILWIAGLTLWAWTIFRKTRCLENQVSESC